MKLLEDEPNFFGSGTVQFLGGNPGYVFVVEPDFTRGGAIEASDQIDESGFSRTGGAHDRQPLTWLNLERNVIEGTNDAASGLGSGRIEPANMIELDHVILPSRC